MDEDLARLLPEPPPPRPARRSATIADAVARFDGDARPRLAPARAARRGIGWGPLGAIASVVVVAAVGIPLALRSPDGQPAPRSTSSAVDTADRSAPVGPSPPSVAAGVRRSAPPQAVVAAPAVRSPAPAVARARVASPPEMQALVAPAPPPPPPPPPAPAPAIMAEMKAAPVDTRAAEGTSDVVVTGSRVSRRASVAGRRGDWNACTLDDPARSLAGCTAVLRTGAKGPAGVAAMHVMDGLASAWRGDTDAAIAAFDAALAVRPKLAIAYLNRALAERRAGDDDRAAADLDRAIRYAPSDARGYYHRALLRRARGDRRHAEADEARAVALDPDYAKLFER